jgi:hypothetical protein
MKRITAIALASTIALGGSVALASSAVAKDNESRLRGVCSGTAGNTWVAKVKGKDSGIRVDFWVKTQQTGQTWTYELKQNNATILTSQRVTRVHDDNGQDDSGHVAEVKWRKHAENTPNAADVFLMTATRGADTCTATLTF